MLTAFSFLHPFTRAVRSMPKVDQQTRWKVAKMILLGASYILQLV